MNCILDHLEDLESWLERGRWSIVIPGSVWKELTGKSTNDTDTGRAAQAALQAIRTSIHNTAPLTIVTSGGADITSSAILPQDQDGIFNSGLFPNIDNDIIDVIKHQELSAPQEIYQGSELNHDQAKSAVLVTDDRALQLKASASGVYSVSPSVFRSLKTDKE